ncbi:MAG TPA: hypothetical protein VIJ14_00225 [Rhabdochlamydiaceae bacterium]
MSKLEDDVLAQFFTELEKKDEITKHMITSLKQRLLSGEKISPEELTRVFSEPADEDKK